jgi:hypothetical protein
MNKQKRPSFFGQHKVAPPVNPPMENIAEATLSQYTNFSLTGPISLLYFQTFCQNLANNTTIKELDLSETQFQAYDLRELLEALSNALEINQTVHTLHYPKNLIMLVFEYGEDLQALTSKIQGRVTLAVPDMPETEITDGTPLLPTSQTSCSIQ